MIAGACLLILLIFFVIVVLNFAMAARLGFESETPLGSSIRLSVLIPARNEEQNLKVLLPALLASNVRPHEILVLDDSSEDGTRKVAEQILESSQMPFQILTGEPWNQSLGLTGKIHACAQLAEAATGDALLFCDADVVPSENAIGKTISFLNRVHCAGMSALPRQITCGQRERLTLPWVMQIPLVTLLPLWLGWRTDFQSLQMANGQWLAVRRERYEEAGGHRALGPDVLDDMALARRLTDARRGGLVPVLSCEDLSVQMYRDWPQMLQGFSKNIVQMYGGTRVVFSLCLALWVALFSFPVWGLFLNPYAALAGAILILVIRLLASSLFQEPVRDLTSHLQSLYWLVILGVNAVQKRGRVAIQWKGRDVTF